ncbi:MAG: M23 family metallopeptidase [Acidobacteriota bacterium]
MKNLLRSKRNPQGETSAERPVLEIQYHPSDIRKGVRYFFLTPSRLRTVGLVTAAWLLLVVFGLYAAPSVIANALARRSYDAELQERARLGERLHTLVGELEGLDTASDDTRLRMAKIYLAYGFSEDEAHGQGGYPHEPAPVPKSNYAGVIRRANGLHASISEQFGVLDAFLQEVQTFEKDHRGQVRNTPSISPVLSEDFVLTSPYGNRTSPFTKELDFHAGIDLAAPIGTPIYAPADGVVAFAGRYPLRQSVGWWRYGNLVALRHGDRFITLFGHCDEVKVQGGQRVSQGDLIATVGDTGWSTNPHLHYEVRRLIDEGGSKVFKPVDPRIYILNHRWRDEETVLIRARSAPSARGFEPLPRRMQR